MCTADATANRRVTLEREYPPVSKQRVESALADDAVQLALELFKPLLVWLARLGAVRVESLASFPQSNAVWVDVVQRGVANRRGVLVAERIAK
jgi:hypothetical protein